MIVNSGIPGHVDPDDAMVCDDCHRSLRQLGVIGHEAGCVAKGRHDHPPARPVEDCLFRQEWLRWRPRPISQGQFKGNS